MSTNRKAAFYTLGCRVNQYETQAIREELEKEGFEEASFDSSADLYVINTCAVTAESVRKARQVIRRALRKKEENPSCVVCVCGCFSQGFWETEDPLLSQADALFGNSKKKEIPSVLIGILNTPTENRTHVDLREDIAKVRCYESLSLSRSHNARAFLKIQDGCNSFCTYCYVPLVRGRVRSRSKDEIRKELLRLTANGYREVVFTGIETGAWGADLAGEESLLTLMEEVADTDGLERIRFGSLKPNLFQEDFCRRLAQIPKILPHFHLSLQSGSDDVLRAMGRKYTREEEKRAVDTIYRYFPDAALSADIICGFPGETEKDFLDSVSLVRGSGLLHTHIFPFSPREGTKAASLSNTVSEETKKKRCAFLLSEAKEQSVSFAEKRVGKTYRVLCERIRDGYMYGYTENFIYTKTPAEENFKVGSVYPVTLTAEKSFSVETMTVSANSAETVDNFEKSV